MLAYSCIPVKDMDRARKFYDSLLGEVGAKVAMERPDGGFVAYSNGKGPMFGICKPYDGGAPDPGNGNMTTLACKDATHVKSMYDKAIELGAKNDGEPGPRLGGQVSCAYVIDPEGNKLNFFCQGS